MHGLLLKPLKGECAMEEIKKLWVLIDYVQEKAKKAEVGTPEHRALLNEWNDLLNKQYELLESKYKKS